MSKEEGKQGRGLLLQKTGRLIALGGVVGMGCSALLLFLGACAIGEGAVGQAQSQTLVLLSGALGSFLGSRIAAGRSITARLPLALCVGLLQVVGILAVCLAMGGRAGQGMAPLFLSILLASMAAGVLAARTGGKRSGRGAGKGTGGRHLHGGAGRRSKGKRPS